jgi:hypothetical protein
MRTQGRGGLPVMLADNDLLVGWAGGQREEEWLRKHGLL